MRELFDTELNLTDAPMGRQALVEAAGRPESQARLGTVATTAKSLISGLAAATKDIQQTRATADRRADRGDVEVSDKLRILITGFGPFPGAPYNPTQPLVARLMRLPIALKVLFGRYAHDDQFVERFRREARLLSSVHSIEETEQLILDFMAEVFFAWWACLYRPEGESYTPKVFRSLNDRLRPAPIDRAALDQVLPAQLPVDRVPRGRRHEAGVPLSTAPTMVTPNWRRSSASAHT